MDLCEAWWEAHGRLATFRSEGFNATSYIFNMTNRFGADWKREAEQINVHEAGDSFAALLGKLTPDVFPVATKYNRGRQA